MGQDPTKSTKPLRPVFDKTVMRGGTPTTTVILNKGVPEEGCFVQKRISVPRAMVVLFEETQTKTRLKVPSIDYETYLDLSYDDATYLLESNNSRIDLRPYLPEQKETIIRVKGRPFGGEKYQPFDFFLSDVKKIGRSNLVSDRTYLDLHSQEAFPENNKATGMIFMMPQAEFKAHLQYARDHDLAILDLTDLKNVKYIHQGQSEVLKKNKPQARVQKI